MLAEEHRPERARPNVHFHLHLHEAHQPLISIAISERSLAAGDLAGSALVFDRASGTLVFEGHMGTAAVSAPAACTVVA